MRVVETTVWRTVVWWGEVMAERWAGVRAGLWVLHSAFAMVASKAWQWESQGAGRMVQRWAVSKVGG